MFPSRRTSLPRTPHSRDLRSPRIRSSKGERALSSPYSPIGALPRGPPPPGLSCETLREELAITGLDWFFAPSPRSTDRIARQDPLGPPPSFRPASPCPGLDRPVSSRTAVTTGPFRPRPSRGLTRCGHVGFPTPPGFGKPLGSPQPCTPRPVFQDGAGDPGMSPLHPYAGCSRGVPFGPPTSITGRFQALFTPLPGFFSAFPHGTAALSVSGGI